MPARSSASPETEAQPVKQSKKRKSEAAADSSTAPLSCAAPEEPQAHKPSKGPARKKARRDATTETEPHPSGQEETGQAAQLSNEPLKAPRSRKKKQKPAEASPLSTEDDAAGVNNADSMPGIPGSGNEMTWKQLDKRTDVKRGRFSQAEKELILAATKVGFPVFIQVCRAVVSADVCISFYSTVIKVRTASGATCRTMPERTA